MGSTPSSNRCGARQRIKTQRKASDDDPPLRRKLTYLRRDPEHVPGQPDATEMEKRGRVRSLVLYRSSVIDLGQQISQNRGERGFICCPRKIPAWSRQRRKERMADKWAQSVSETRWEEDTLVRASACCWARSDVGREKEKKDGAGWLGFGS